LWNVGVVHFGGAFEPGEVLQERQMNILVGGPVALLGDQQFWR